MSRYQAIALDMDGTLLNRDHKISSATRAALPRPGPTASRCCW
jgi:hydroxymethylpyrimidine pyrophosphatase-like HAD family hydrolase